MKQLAYSSTAAFLAHYRVLSNAAAEHGSSYPLSPQEREILEATRQLMETLTPEERTILLADAAGDETCVSGEEQRRCERAQLKLRRLLLTKGVIRG